MVVVQLAGGPWTWKFQDWFLLNHINALKHGRDMEIEAAKTFIEFIKGKLTDIKLNVCGLFVDDTLPYVGTSPDRVLLCSCCEKACVKIKSPYSINYTKPRYSNLEYLRLYDGRTVLKKSHKYYTQCYYWTYNKLFCCLDSPLNDYWWDIFW